MSTEQLPLQRFAAPTQASNGRAKPSVPPKVPAAQGISGAKRVREALKPSLSVFMSQTARPSKVLKKVASESVEDDDSFSVASFIAESVDIENITPDDASQEPRIGAIAPASATDGPAHDADSVDSLAASLTPGTAARLDGLPLFRLEDQRRFIGRAKRIISEELLPIHNVSARELLHKKQCNLLLLEEHIRTGGLNNPEAAARLREASVVLEAKKMEVVTVAVRAANHVREVVEKTREIQEKTHQIEKLTAERDALKTQLLSAASSSQSQEDKLAAINSQYQEKLEEAHKLSASAVNTVTKQLKVQHEQDLASHATKAADQQKLVVAEALRKAHAEHASKEAAITAKLHAATEQIAVLKGQVEQLEVVLSNTQQDLTDRLAAADAALVAATDKLREWELKFDACDSKRLALLEECLTLKGSIRVFARVRPHLDAEVDEMASSSTDVVPLFTFPSARDDATVVELVEKPGLGVGGYGVGEAKHHKFEYQRVFPPLASQEELFTEAEGLVQSALNGHRACVFAYGQTGSGKTFTMQGSNGEQRGLIPRSVEYIFQRLALMATNGWTFNIAAQMLEIYNEELRDLLSPAAPGIKHEIRHDKDGNTTVTHLSSHHVSTVKQVYDLLETAAKHRSMGSTNSNIVSSRSHSVFTLSIHLTHAGTAQRRHGILNLIDLAGSERIAKSGVNDCKAGGSDKLLKETQHINKSLSSLSQVIMALKSHQAHIPYRDSKLTYFLQNSLGGDCKTLMICNLNPLHANSQESLCTLRFAKAVSEVTTGK